jgi:hypothetical protein
LLLSLPTAHPSSAESIEMLLNPTDGPAMSPASTFQVAPL